MVGLRPTLSKGRLGSKEGGPSSPMVSMRVRLSIVVVLGVVIGGITLSIGLVSKILFQAEDGLLQPSGDVDDFLTVELSKTPRPFASNSKSVELDPPQGHSSPVAKRSVDKNCISSTFASDCVQVVRSTSGDGFGLLIVLGLSPSAMSLVCNIFSELSETENVILDMSLNNLAKDLLGLDLMAKLVNETGSLDYPIRNVTPELRANLTRSLWRLRNDLITKHGTSNRLVVLSFPSAIYVVPFIEEVFRGLSISYVLPVQDGHHAVFENGFGFEMNVIGPHISDEDVIDNLCLDRVRPRMAGKLSLLQSVDFFYPPPFPMEPNASSRPRPLRKLPYSRHIREIRGWTFHPNASSHDPNVVPCNIREISILRNAIAWNLVHSSLLRMLLLESRHSFLIRVEDVISNTQGFHDVLDEMVGKANGKREFRGQEHRLPSLLENRFVHRTLVEQVSSVLGEKLLEYFQYKGFSADENPDREYVPLKPVTRIIDAGTCSQMPNIEKYAQGTRGSSSSLTSAASCLPSFMLIGVQKAGTDELAVWLNFNNWFKRLDGGVETHFFDCVGRGMGLYRPPCTRYRDPTMKHSQQGLDKVTEENAILRWADFREKSPYMDDHWKEYQNLGNENYFNYKKRKQVVFEKTPAYFDLANPKDVVRLLPSVKLLILLRNPTNRLFSGYWHSCSGQMSSRSTCTVEEFESSVMTLKQKGVDGIKHEIFLRSLQHGIYVQLINKWRAVFPDSQIMVLFARDFKHYPQAVVYAIETYLGLRKKQHYVYKPFMQDGYYVLGDYSKASHPSHSKDVKLSPQSKQILDDFYRPWNAELVRVLSNSTIKLCKNSPNIPYEHDFQWPPWLKPHAPPSSKP